MDLRRDGWIGGVSQWVSGNGMSECVVFGHQCEHMKYKVVLARHSTTKFHNMEWST